MTYEGLPTTEAEAERRRRGTANKGLPTSPAEAQRRAASAAAAREQARRSNGEFGTQFRDEADIDPDTLGLVAGAAQAVLEQAILEARELGRLEGRAEAFEEAADLIHEDASVASALTGHVMRHPEGAWQITVPDESGYEMTDMVLAAASTALRERAASERAGETCYCGEPDVYDGHAECPLHPQGSAAARPSTGDADTPLGEPVTCPTCGGHGYGYVVGPAADGGTLRSGECVCCFGTGTIPNTGSTRECDYCHGTGSDNNSTGAHPCAVCDGLRRVPTTALGQAEVVVPGHGRFGRISTGNETEKAEYWAREPYAFRLEANRPLTDDEIRKAAGLFGYSYRAAVAGEPIGEPQRDSDRSFIVAADTTKSSRDDLGMALDTLINITPGLLREGSPVRKTDRAGAGTRGTRLVEGFNDIGLSFALYADDYDE